MRFRFHGFEYSEKELISILSDVFYLSDLKLVINAIADKDVTVIEDLIEGIEVIEVGIWKM